MNPRDASRPAGVRLAGTGMALPERLVTNQDMAELVDTSDEWIAQRTGITQRYLCQEGQGTLDLAAAALRQAVANAGIKPSDLDLVICATITPEMCCPSTAARIVDLLGAVPAGAMDISVACSGFVYGVNMADSLIRTGLYRHVGVIGAEALSKITDWADRRTCVLFGDGAGAAVFSAGDDPGQGSLYHTMRSDGSGWAHLYCPRTEADLPPGDTVFSGAYNTLQMNGREIYKFAVKTLIACAREAFEACDVQAGDVAAIIPHQSNARILESAREKLGISEEQLYINIDRVANTSAASIPICLHELVESGRLKQGDLALLVALGGGLTWASNLWRL